MSHRKYIAGIAALLAVIAVARVVQTYRVTAQTFDEPCHVSAAIELLDKGTYTLDSYNTPLARIGIGLPLYLAGERYPEISPDDPNGNNYNYVGNKILYDDGHYMRNLILARTGVLPFLLLSVLVVFLWARREFGDLAALMAVALFTTLPPVLAFSSIAYSDMATAFAQSAALFAFATWLDKPSTRTCLWMGITLGLAVLAKFTTLLYLPAAAAAIVGCKWLMERKRATPRENRNYSPRQIAVALLIAIVAIWGGYRFAIGHVQESMQVSPQTMPSFQHLPASLRPVARKLVLSDPALPAPGLFRGIVSAYIFTKEGASSYFLGTTKTGGWWYFFLADLAVKSPLPFLILSAIGFVGLAGFVREKKWTPLAPGVSAFAILLATTTVKVYYGIRHVIVLFPLLAIVAGYGAAWLWQRPGSRRIWGRLLLAGLLLWQCVSTVAARHDYIAYFNELAGQDPSRIFVAGCDLDCGQDLFRLSQVAHARHISRITVAIWSSADLTQSDLPAVIAPEPFVPTPGWFAISLRARRIGDFLHTSYPPGAFAWLDHYQPVERVGKTILLYYIPENGGSPPVLDQ